MKSLPEATRMKSVAKTRKKSTGLADYTSASRCLRLFCRGNKCVFLSPSKPQFAMRWVMLNRNRKIKKTSKKSPPSSNWRMRMSLFRMFSPMFSPSLYLYLSLPGCLTDTNRYKIGDTFFQLPLAEAQALLATSTEEAEGEVTKLEESMGDLREELQQLKVALYARFGRGINLEA